jgi:hypothetical protein
MEAVLIAVAVGAVGGLLIGRWKHRPVLGTVIGAVFGVLGWIVLAVVPAKPPILRRGATGAEIAAGEDTMRIIREHQAE